MRKKGFRRFQLFLLAIVVVLLIWRMQGGPGASDGFLTMTNLDERQLYTEHFEVFSPTTLKISGVAAFEDDRIGSSLAVYPWIVDRTRDEVAWIASAADVKREGVQAIISDSIEVEAGEYSLYYTTLGSSTDSQKGGSFMGLKPHWTNYDSFWTVSLKAPVGVANRLKMVGGSADPQALIWHFQPKSQVRNKATMIHLKQAASLNLNVTATVCPIGCSDVKIIRIPEETLVWSLSNSELKSAGGARTNQSFSGQVELQAGIYRLSFDSGSGFGRRSWSVNPPLLPYEWGIRVSSKSADVVQQFDPWNGADPIIAHLKVGDSETHISTLDLDEALDIIVFGMGELTSDSNTYDWGWIEDNASSRTIWEMSYAESEPAGGAESNRSQMAILRLEPGSYSVKYKSDGSHSYAGFNKKRPTIPDRWGIAVFALEPDNVTEGSVRAEVVQTRVTSERAAFTGSSPLRGVADDRFIVRHTSLGNERSIDTTFELSEATQVIVSALGEISSSQRFDYGWIESEVTGETVWEMTYENTWSAGSDDSFRMIASIVTLPAGTYHCRFRTDQGLAYGSWGSSEPDNPEDWGIAIFRAEEER